ncbi:MAG: hypothetical protein V4569_01510 [Pseudomonadota bacterium]
MLTLLVTASVLAAVAGGLLRAGVHAPTLTHPVFGHAAVAHAALMLSGFFGTVIAIERAVAIKLRWAFAVPLASGSASFFVLGGHADNAAWVWVAAALVFVAVNLVLVFRQRASHTALLLLGAVAWLVGNLLFATDLRVGSALPWWFAFPVLTIAAERLEMTRLMRRHPWAPASLIAVLLALLSGAALSAVAPAQGGVLFGLALAALAAWLGVFDIARRTVFARGLSRYMALCLLAGYGWLGVAGLAWSGMALGYPGRDMAFHALGLGFIVSMVMGHAPVILPAVARIKLRFGPWFYIPLAWLHASLLLRVFGGSFDQQLLVLGAELNAIALVVFAVTLVGSAIASRARRPRA